MRRTEGAGGSMTRGNWQVTPGSHVELRERDASSTAAAPGDRAATERLLAEMHEALGELQTRLWAEGKRSVLVVLQGIDASGKDGTIGHVFRGLNPLGTKVTAFKAPSAEELAHDFLWRVHARCPAHGEFAIFNRSHYEDVLIVRVHKLFPKSVWSKRYDHINNFERLLADSHVKTSSSILHASAPRHGPPRCPSPRDNGHRWWRRHGR